MTDAFFRVFNNTHTSRQVYTDLSDLPVWNADKLQNLPINRDLETTCVNGDVLFWDGAEWICKAESVGLGVPVPFLLEPNNRLINIDNNSRQYGRVVQIQMTADVGTSLLVGNNQNFIGFIENADQRPDNLSIAVSMYTPTTPTFFGFEAAIGAVGGLFIKPGLTVPLNQTVVITGSYNTILL